VGTLGLIALYMVLASLFNSLTHPFTIMTSAPLSFIGGFVALKLTGNSLDMMSGIGLLVLMGLVMKNGILLVDYTNQLREAGHSREEAILRAVGAEFRAPMGMITIGGLITSTALTLVVVPVVYSLVDEATVLAKRGARRLRAALLRIGTQPS
jgi:HAE1 family hydrophobic/amphiphilic exporter-1